MASISLPSLTMRRVVAALFLCISGLFFIAVGASYLSLLPGRSVTTKYTKGCIVSDLRPENNSFHQIDLGQFDTTGRCKDVHNFQIGYQLTTTDLQPPFPKNIARTILPEVEIWYKSPLSTAQCGTDRHSCQLASIVALRTYTLRGKTVQPDVLYKSTSFTITGDLTQAGYNPDNATYTTAGVALWLPLIFFAGGLLLLGGSGYVFRNYVKNEKRK